MNVNDNTIDADTIRKMQISELFILEEFSKFCESNKLIYTLDFGTILGAIRHKGFIPWDDDIDIAMLRVDYDRFLKLSADWNQKNIFVQNYHTDPEFVHSFTRLRLNGTLAVQSDWQYLNVHHGIFIDIFPYDVIAGNEEECKEHADKIRAIQDKKMVLVNTRTATPENMSHLNLQQTDLITKYNDLKYRIINEVSHMTQGLETYYESRRTQSDFKYSTTKMFETKTFPIPLNYDKILKNVYGDYMAYPDIENQKPHHDVIQLKFRQDILDLYNK